MIPALLALALSSADPCAPIEPAGSAPDPAAAAAYRAVGDEEQGRGSSEAAAAAYRGALSRDPSDGASRDALRRLCPAGAVTDDPVRRGLSLMDAGDFRAAIDAFRAAAEIDPGPSLALLQAICQYELGEDAVATPLFQEAEAYAPHREEARLYLGLIALRAGAGRDAVALFESARTNPALEPAARDLARLAHASGRVVVSLVAESGWDSNVTLAPSGEPGVDAKPDGLYALTGGVLVRPSAENGPYLRAAALTHEPFRLAAYRVRGFDAAAGWQLRRPRASGLVEYDFGTRTFGGEPYLTAAHRLLAAGSVRAGPIGLGLAYLVRLESFATAWSRFDGVLQRGELRATWATGRHSQLALAYLAGRDGTDDAVLSYTEHGPRAELRVLGDGTWTFGVEASLIRRRYGEYDPAYGLTRRDTYLAGLLFADAELATGWTLRLALEGRKTTSNVAALEYEKIVPTVGIAYVRGF